jgi:hypothetical protein
MMPRDPNLTTGPGEEGAVELDERHDSEDDEEPGSLDYEALHDDAC